MDGTLGSVSMDLIQQVATYTETDAVELPPLYHTIDPDALETCVTKLDGIDLSFEYAGVPVTVESSGDVCLGAESAAATIWVPEDCPAQPSD